MQKVVMVIVALAITLALVNAANEKIPKEQLAKILEEAGKKCAEEQGLTEEQTERVKKNEPLQTKEEKCTIGCLYKQFGLLKDNKFNAEAFLEGSRMVFKDDAPELEKIAEIANTCEEEVGTVEDECELAVQAMNCKAPLMKAAGIPFRD